MNDQTARKSRFRHEVEDLIASLPEEAAFMSSDGQAFLSLPVGRGFQTFPISSPYIRDYLTVHFSTRNATEPDPGALDTAIRTLRARAHTSGRVHPIDIRILSTTAPATIYIDLANIAGESVEITPSGWRVTPTSPVLFQSTRGQRELPHPTLDRSPSPPSSFASSLLNSFAPSSQLLHLFTSSPILLLSGPPNSGKTTLARMLRALIDPVNAPIQPLPSRGADVLDLARRDRVLVFDHVTRMSNSVADALCQITSGTAVTTREPGDRHREPLRLNLARPVILTTPTMGVHDWQPRPDLASRIISIHLPELENPKPEAELWAEFEAARPSILGQIYTALSESLAAPKPLFRSDPACVLSTLHHHSCESDPLFRRVLSFSAVHPEWSGTATDLANELCVTQSPRALSHNLRLLKSTLSAHQITVRFHRLHAGVRQIQILRHRPSPPPSSNDPNSGMTHVPSGTPPSSLPGGPAIASTTHPPPPTSHLPPPTTARRANSRAPLYNEIVD